MSATAPLRRAGMLSGWWTVGCDVSRYLVWSQLLQVVACNIKVEIHQAVILKVDLTLAIAGVVYGVSHAPFRSGAVTDVGTLFQRSPPAA